jgi:hypothetical protein
MTTTRPASPLVAAGDAVVVGALVVVGAAVVLGSAVVDAAGAAVVFVVVVVMTGSRAVEVGRAWPAEQAAMRPTVNRRMVGRPRRRPRRWITWS